MQRQLQTNWCWAATSTSVAHFYKSSSGETQCRVACACLSRNDCCTDPQAAADTARCNQPWYLDQALKTVNAPAGHLRTMQSSATPYPAVVSEIAKRCPLGVRVGWSGGGGHFVVICGYDYDTTNAQQDVEIDDPIYGPSVVPYTTLINGKYQGSGTWTHSYPTQP